MQGKGGGMRKVQIEYKVMKVFETLSSLPEGEDREVQEEIDADIEYFKQNGYQVELEEVTG